MKFTLAVAVLMGYVTADPSAKEQSDIIWKQIEATKGSNMPFSKIGAAHILTMDMKKPFAKTDYMQTITGIEGFIDGGKTIRPKSIHT